MIARTLQNAFFPQGESRIDRVLQVIITVAFIISVLATVYVITIPKEGERFTEFFILGENRTSTAYPDQISIGQGILCNRY
jgi:uncharacterized membrane protein